jgi:uncharacterized membrane protein
LTSRSLKIALAASVALNLFAIAAGVTAYIGQARVEERVEEQRRPGRADSPMAVVRSLDPEVRRPVRQALRDAALTARPDFEEARTARREAIALASSATMDQARILALLDRARSAEMRGRERIETDSVALLATLDPADRAKASVILSRHGRRAAKAPDSTTQPPVQP